MALTQHGPSGLMRLGEDPPVMCLSEDPLVSQLGLDPPVLHLSEDPLVSQLGLDPPVLTQ